jgi:probable F420-dependent oxidoreductase
MSAVEALLSAGSGTTGIWAAQMRSRDRGKVREVAAAVEDLGFSAVWAPGAAGGALFDDVDAALAATSRIVIATAVLNIAMHDAKETAAWVNAVRSTAPDRLLLGVGVSHAHRVAAMGQKYRPMAAMQGYLDELDSVDPPVGKGDRLIGALGPRMLEVARDRAMGAHTYMVTPAHTAAARRVLGKDRLLAPEVKVILDSDRDRALETARAHIAHYLEIPNYTRNLLRSGYCEQDLRDGGSARLIDGLFAIGDVDVAKRRIDEHRAAGADHICVQVVTPKRGVVPMEEWRRLADAVAET